MTSGKCLKVVICAEYQGDGAVEGSTTGFQKIINEWINQSGIDNTINVIVYCLGTETKTYKVFHNVTFKQYKSNLSIRDVIPFIPTTIFPFLIDLLPIHPKMIKDIIKEKPDVIHTFLTVGNTDISGYIAAKIMKLQKKEVRFINTVMGEMETYFADYIKLIVSFFYKIIDHESLLLVFKNSINISGNRLINKDKVHLYQFLLYAPVRTLFCTVFYVLLKLFEWLGNLQDFLVAGVKFFLGVFLKQKYDRLEDKILVQINRLRQLNLTSKYKEKPSSWLGYLAKPVQLIYDFVRRGDNEGPRVGVKGLLANTFRWLLEKEIPAYLNSCDSVTISRNEDLYRYQIKTQVWDIPFACDLDKFQVYEPSVNNFISKVTKEIESDNLSFRGGIELIDFVKNREKIAKRSILYVGRLSDEKNISILVDACEQLLRREGMRDQVHLIFIGAGYAAVDIKNRFRENVTVTGLVPNYLLPDIYNFIRQSNGFFVSASDTETYALTHEEATACGVPLVAMEKGTRGHFYCPGDKIGKFTIDRDDDIDNAIDLLIDPYRINDFIIALNGLCVPDYSAGLGLSKLSSNYSGKYSATEALLSAMYVMAILPDNVIAKMSQHASKFTFSSKLSWYETWQLLKNVYVNDWESYQSMSKPKKHLYDETKKYFSNNKSAKLSLVKSIF